MLETSSDNGITENEACDNTIADAEDISTGTGNLWVDNEFGTVGLGIPPGNLSDDDCDDDDDSDDDDDDEGSDDD